MAILSRNEVDLNIEDSCTTTRYSVLRPTVLPRTFMEYVMEPVYGHQAGQSRLTTQSVMVVAYRRVRARVWRPHTRADGTHIQIVCVTSVITSP